MANPNVNFARNPSQVRGENYRVRPSSALVHSGDNSCCRVESTANYPVYSLFAGP